MPAKYPWLLPADHPLYQPFLGFSRPMSRRQQANALARFARSFARDLRTYTTSCTMDQHGGVGSPATKGTTDA